MNFLGTGVAVINNIPADFSVNSLLEYLTGRSDLVICII